MQLGSRRLQEVALVISADRSCCFFFNTVHGRYDFLGLYPNTKKKGIQVPGLLWVLGFIWHLSIHWQPALSASRIPEKGPAFQGGVNGLQSLMIFIITRLGDQLSHCPATSRRSQVFQTPPSGANPTALYCSSSTVLKP